MITRGSPAPCDLQPRGGIPIEPVDSLAVPTKRSDPPEFSYRLDVFEGPLDLLLHLIQKHKLQIDQINITILLAQYLDYMAQLRSLHLEIASEFLAMAAHLVYIKTISLLPAPPADDSPDADQLRQELSLQLLEHQRCQQVAARLKAQFLGHTLFVRPPAPPNKEHTLLYDCQHAADALTRAYRRAVGKGDRRLPLKPAIFSPLVARSVVSVRSRIAFLLDCLAHHDSLPHDTLFPQGADRSEMIATFLAMLELLKEHRLQLQQLPPPLLLE